MIKSIDIHFAYNLLKIQSDTSIKTTTALATPKRDAEILYKIVNYLKPNNILEIGTFYGHTTYGFAINSMNSNIYTIDIHSKMKIHVPEFQEIELLRQDEVGVIFKNENLKINQVFGDSRKIETYNNIPNIDFAFIDGFHSFRGVCADFYCYGSLVRPGGLIGIHDIYHSFVKKDVTTCDVYKFWLLLQNIEPGRTLEIFKEGKVHWTTELCKGPGIGVFQR